MRSLVTIIRANVAGRIGNRFSQAESAGYLDSASCRCLYYYYIYIYSQLHVGHTNILLREATGAQTPLSRSQLWLTKRLQNRRTGFPIQPHLVCVALLQCDMHACSTVCHFAHARPTMRSILLVLLLILWNCIIGASVSEPPLVDSTDALSR